MAAVAHYWGFNAISSILRTQPSVSGDLYIPTPNRRTQQLVALAAGHPIKVYHRKHSSAPREGGDAVRYPLLITATAIAPKGVYRTVERYLSAVDEGDAPPAARQLVLILDNITDVGNIAAIARSAYNFGVTCLVTSHKTASHVPLLVHRSAGYYLQLNVVEQVNIAHAIQTLKQRRFWMYGADAGGEALAATAFDRLRCALVVGDEHSGLRAQTKRLCDFMVAIPQRAACESLNVAVATGIILYEIDRQRLAYDR